MWMALILSVNNNPAAFCVSIGERDKKYTFFIQVKVIKIPSLLKYVVEKKRRLNYLVTREPRPRWVNSETFHW